MSTEFNITERLKQGRQVARRQHKELDAKKLGILRAGNSGMMAGNGDVAGSCHRIAHLRALGIEVDPPDDPRLIMFQLGLASEDIVVKDLEATLAPDETLLREEEIPIQWMTDSGTKVSGRPDVVICLKESSKPILGIELKSVHSVWTSRDILGGEPKMEHLIQAAHYSWQLGIPFRLIYKQYSIQEIPGWKGSGSAPGWGQKLFPKDSPFIDYEKGRVQQYEIVFELSWAKDRLRYRRESYKDQPHPWTSTLVTHHDVKRFYEFVSTMAEKKELGPRPLNVGPDGKEKNWSRCDPKYCPLAGVCEAKEGSGYDKWLKEVKKVLGAKS